ncbi:MAG: hypothetical protein JWM27_3248 [Gemmatimonadetes bacterium]|nr:hypothetical protein [Gemmatimonadota bacterium]
MTATTSPALPRAPRSRRAAPRRRPAPLALAGAVLLVVLVGAADWITGPEISVAVFYLVPVALATWWGSRRHGIATALLCGVVWLSCDAVSHTYSHPAISYWNATVRVGTWITMALLVSALRAAADREADRRRRAGGRAARPPARAEPFYAALEREFEQLADGGPAFTLAYVDVAGIEGAAVPDEDAREAVIHHLRGVLRRSDGVGSPRGREIALLLVETGPDAAPAALERIRAALAELGASSGISTSIGAVTCTGPVPDLNTVLQRAYQQMYFGRRAPGDVTVAHETLGATESAPAGDGPADAE